MPSTKITLCPDSKTTSCRRALGSWSGQWTPTMGAMGALLVYDVTEDHNFCKFEHVSYRTPRTCRLQHIMLIRDKIDLKHLRSVALEDATRFVEMKSLSFSETCVFETINLVLVPSEMANLFRSLRHMPVVLYHDTALSMLVVTMDV
uniref:Uncharacterized protein n=1 Tax=Oryza meridionalis TaxID=40149 RepID=A0A0E0FCV3_9ORYZ